MNAKTYTYRGCLISRITSHNMASMRWESHCLGRFIKAETLADMRQMIADSFTPICGRARPGSGWRARA